MTLKVDNVFVDYLFVDEVNIRNAYVNGALVFSGPEPPIFTNHVWETALDPATSGQHGYKFNEGVGNLTPKEWLGEFISALFVNQGAGGDVTLVIDSIQDLTSDFFAILAIAEKGTVLYTNDASLIYTWDPVAETCTWFWPDVGISVGTNSYNIAIYERQPPEMIVDFNLLPGENTGGTLVGMRTTKVNSDNFGDLDPPHFQGEMVGRITEQVDGSAFVFGSEGVNLRKDWFRSIQIVELDFTLFEDDANYDNTANNGTFWTWNNKKSGMVPGVNYTFRVRGVDPILFTYEFELFPIQQQDTGNPEGNYIIGYNSNQNPFITPPPADIAPNNYKSQEFALLFYFGNNPSYFIGIGTGNQVPQSYWTTMNFPDLGFTVNSIDILYNNLGDGGTVNSNVWGKLGEQLPFVAGVPVAVELIGDSHTVSTTQMAQAGHRREGFSLVAEKSGGVVGYRSGDLGVGSLSTSKYKNRTVAGVYVNLVYNTFVIVLDAEDILQTSIRIVRIPELDWKIELKDMLFDNRTLKGKAIWTSKTVPLLKPGVTYSFWFWD